MVILRGRITLDSKRLGSSSPDNMVFTLRPVAHLPILSTRAPRRCLTSRLSAEFITGSKIGEKPTWFGFKTVDVSRFALYSPSDSCRIVAANSLKNHGRFVIFTAATLPDSKLTSLASTGIQRHFQLPTQRDRTPCNVTQ